MTPDQFQRAKRIYNSALEREPTQREAYLVEACGGDGALREEVESLLGCRTEAEEFFREPAVEAGAQALASEPPSDLTGRSVSHYALVEKIGEGGMGVVYKARDTHLDRFVALKLLPFEKVDDPQRKQRFVQEAKAASALDHPNIVTIHDIDTADGVTFIAMELVKGRTLDRLIRDKGIILGDTLKYGVQIADALAAAHRAGIIHRDIKPTNITVTETGKVKVLDFGLAKLTDPVESATAEATGTLGQKTEAGMILGTVAYMSPEQAEGKRVDARSDIFSLGSVLYEMATGRRAFSGETNASTLAAVLREDPKPVSQAAPNTPLELERVISRCLRKNPERRFQHMADLKVALEELKEESDSGALGPSAAPGRRLPRRLAWAAGAFLLAAALGVGAWFGFFRPSARPVEKVAALTALRGIQTEPALSPDGKQVAFAWNGEKQDNFDIYVQLLGEATPRRLTTDPAVEYMPAWSPDGLHIAFLRDTRAGTEVVIIPAAGGDEKRQHVSTVSCGLTPWRMPFCGLSWSPNGRFLTFVDQESPGAPGSVYLLDIDTRGKHKLTTPPPGFDDGLSVFSPDGRSLAFLRLPGVPLPDIYILPLSDNGQPRGEPQRIIKDNNCILGLDWTRDGRSIVFSSIRAGVFALWRIARSGGLPELLSVSGNDAYWPSISRSGDRLAYSYGNTGAQLWRVPAPGGPATGDRAAAPTKISYSQYDQEPVFSPDSRKIAWASMHSSSEQILVGDSDGSQLSALTHFVAPGAAEPDWSPDGRQIAFLGYSPSPRRVYMIDADGGAPRRVSTGDFTEDAPSWSRDGKWVYFTSNRGGGDALWRAPVGGGSPILVARNGWQPVESFDGNFVYYTRPDDSIWKSPSAGGSPVILARKAWAPIFEAPDGKFVYYSGPDNTISKVPVTGGAAVPLLKIGRRAMWTSAAAGIYVLDPDAKGGPAIGRLSFTHKFGEMVRLPGEPGSYTDVLGGPSVSPDGRWIVYLHRDRTDTVIMLVENFR